MFWGQNGLRDKIFCDGIRRHASKVTNKCLLNYLFFGVKGVLRNLEQDLAFLEVIGDI